jgi:hypothetical protein
MNQETPPLTANIKQHKSDNPVKGIQIKQTCWHKSDNATKTTGNFVNMSKLKKQLYFP